MQSSIFRAMWAVLLGLPCVFSLPSFAQAPLTLAEAQRIAQTRSAGITAAASGAKAANEAAIASSQLPDPVFRAGLDNVPVNGPDAFSLDRDFMTMRRVGLMQEYVSSDKRSLRRVRGEKEAARWEADAAVSRAEVRTDVAAAFYDRSFAEQRIALLEGLAEEIAMQQRATEAQIANGRASASDSLSMRAMLFQARDRVIAARQQREVATARLARWLGPDDARRPLASFSLPSESDLTAAAPDISNTPHLATLTRQLDVAEADVALAQSNRDPNWTWEVSYSQRGPAYSNMISVGVSVPLPIDRAARQDTELVARIALRDQARDLLEDARRLRASQLAEKLIEWRALRARQRNLEDEFLPLSKQRVDAALAAYGATQQSLAVVLEARRADIEARLQVIDLQQEAARLWAVLRYTYVGLEGDQP